MRQSSPDTDPEALAAPDALCDAALAVSQTDRGASKSHNAVAVRVDTYDRETGLVTYADAAGTLFTKPAAEWIAFMATRLHHIARAECTRQFNAACNDLDEAACADLEARVTRELRIDALQALAHRSDQVFAEAQAERYGRDPAALSAEKVDLTALDVLQLTHLHEAYQAARHLWEGVGARPYSIAWRDPRGWLHLTKAGKIADFEEQRAGLIVDRIVGEMASRTPRNVKERDRSLVLRLRHELDCEDRIRSDALMREITQAWEA
ncbi:hypothetical protein EU555_35820 [Methylobacterium nonmethylotrophicum]|uniref:Uncharacterized protein n=2 Tax=Methylobacterium nonmethylotrophicum TaxID=1141884 RepID=A0A4Z0NCC9_9HYPH|nr:hypothetical protein EU555_35820 [Methylobacterium nonmethylotrophicum]